MASRRSSVASSRNPKNRKYSTDRFQRGAELEIRNEEGRPTRPPLVHEESIEPEFLQEIFSKAKSDEGIRSLSRADSSLSPLEVHPGHRIRGFSRVGSLHISTDFAGAYIKPFAEPEEPLQSSRGKASTVTHVDHESQENVNARIQRSASEARSSHQQLFRNVYNRLRGRQAVKPGAFRGVELASSLAMAHANALLSSKSEHFDQRRALYVLEFKNDESGRLIPVPPKPFAQTDDLKLHLEKSTSQVAFRIIYSCNRDDTLSYLCDAFGISDESRDKNERDFRAWMQNDRPSRGSVNKAVKWRPCYDIARNMVSMAFGIDFGSIILPSIPNNYTSTSHLPHKNKPSSRPTNMYRQRLAVYLQRELSTINPSQFAVYNTGSRAQHQFCKIPTIIICEYSSSAIGEIIHAPSLLSIDPGTLATTLETFVIDIISQVRQIWTNQLALMHDEYTALEDLVYEQPSNAAQAHAVWAMSQHLHDMLKLVNRHAKLVEGVQTDFGVFAERTDEQDWLDSIINEFVLLSADLRSDYIQPSENMIDYMYKSIQIRDSRQSLDLAVSLWRLSWITFIFLPLTFLCGFFGMNVDTFQVYPDIKWYFISAVPLFGIITLSWVVFRYSMPSVQAWKTAIYSDSDRLRLRNVALLKKETNQA